MLPLWRKEGKEREGEVRKERKERKVRKERKEKDK
jgi:hypothetical protein